MRLGLWGRGTAFEDFKAFEEEINRAGVGMMEVLAMDMKSRGMFVSRQLSFHGCSFEMKRCELTEVWRRYRGDIGRYRCELTEEDQ